MSFFKGIYSKILAALTSKRGHNLLLFTAFLLLAFILWLVLAISEDAIVDMNFRVRIVNVPDSVIIISNPPEAIAVSARLHGSQRIKFGFTNQQQLNINYNSFLRKNAIQLSPSDLKNIIRGVIPGAEIITINPDSISLNLTSSPGTPYPVVIDFIATSAPQFSIIGQPKPSHDSVLVYSATAIAPDIKAVATSKIRLTDLRQPTTVRVPLSAPAGTRVVPDSIDVSFDVQSLILKNRKVNIEAINTPAGYKLITFPAQVDLTYMIPMSRYSEEHKFRVIVDCAQITPTSQTLPLQIVEAPQSVSNISLSVDSVEYIIEHL